MATRRAHNKSRLGCHQCKKRRIKCDNKHPSCANCDKRAITCSFLDLAPSSSLSVTSASSSSSSLISLARTSQTPSSISILSPALTTPLSHVEQLDHLHPPSPPGQSSNDWTLAPSVPQALTGSGTGEPMWDLLTAMNPSLFQPLKFPESPAAPQMRLDDAWKDIRDQLPPALQAVLKHYEYTTSLTLATDDPAKAAWQSFIPELAHKHDFLVNCVLSVAALHLGRLCEDEAQKRRMNAIAASRMNKALKTYRPELECVTEENAAALFASSTLTAVYLFRTSALDIEHLRASIPPDALVCPPAIVDKMMACVLRTIWGLRGPLTVLSRGWNWVVDGKMSEDNTSVSMIKQLILDLDPVAARKWWPRKRVPATPRAMEEDVRLEKLERLWLDSDDPDKSFGPQSNHLSQALAFLRDSYALVSQLTLPHAFPRMTSVPYSVDDTSVGVLMDRGAIFVWATRMSREFITLVENKDRDALVVLAHYAVLPGRVRNVWWLEGLGVDFVTSIALALGREHWHLISWPASVLGIDLDGASGMAFWGQRVDNLEGLPGEMNLEVI